MKKLLMGLFVFSFLLVGSQVYMVSAESVMCPSNGAPFVTVVTPNGGEVYQAGQEITIGWVTCNVPGNISEINLVPTDIQYGQGLTLEKDISNTGSYVVTLPTTPDNVNNYYSFGKNFKIEIVAGSSDMNNLVTDSSDNLFTINSATPSITVLTPNGRDMYEVGQQINVTWNSTGISASNNNIDITLHGYNANGVIVWSKELSSFTLNDGQEKVILPTYLGGVSFGKNFVISVGTDSTNNPSPISDFSDTTFTIGKATDVTNGGCSNGEIYSSTSGQKCPIILYCTDSDGGYDEYKKGTLDWLTLDAGLLNNVDSCTAETTQPTTITEYGCVNQQSYSKVLTCPYGCSNGACINKVITDNGCTNGEIYSSTSGQKCPGITTPSLKVLSPNGGETYTAGQQITVKWTSSNIVAKYVGIILVDKTNIIPTSVLVDQTLNDGSEVVTLPMSLGRSFEIFITNDASGGDYSDNTFSIVPQTVDNSCLNGAIYSSMTGKKCSEKNEVRDTGCIAGYNYSSTTGKPCALGLYKNDNIDVLNPTDSTIPVTSSLKRTLKIGIKGDDVRALQAFLNLLADGSFGPKTQAKVMEWQAAHGLTPDGSFGRMSREKAGLTQ